MAGSTRGDTRKNENKPRVEFTVEAETERRAAWAAHRVLVRLTRVHATSGRRLGSHLHHRGTVTSVRAGRGWSRSGTPTHAGDLERLADRREFRLEVGHVANHAIWASVQGDPVFMRRVNGFLAQFRETDIEQA